MVLNYVPEGNLRDYLQKNHSKLTLKNRIIIFRYLCIALNDIHKKDLIHCDLHSGNILLQGGGCYITDLGLCGPVDEKSSNKIYGIVSYVAPELLRGKINAKNTKETDIYSVGMWIHQKDQLLESFMILLEISVTKLLKIIMVIPLLAVVVLRNKHTNHIQMHIIKVES